MFFKYLLLTTILCISTRVSFGITGVDLLANFRTSDFVFDLLRSNPARNGNNTIRQLSVSQFPVLAYMGISYTLFELAPCGINLPHVHPRATELLYVRKFVHLLKRSVKRFKTLFLKGYFCSEFTIGIYW